MSVKYKRRRMDKIKFSIGAKLITIISLIVIISLGSITALVSWLVREDLQITAEENNFEANRRSAIEAETLLAIVRSNSRMLIQTVSFANPRSGSVQELADFFFNENPQIAAIFFVFPGKEERLLVNKQFFNSQETDEKLAASFFDSRRSALGRVLRGEQILLNAAPHFARPILALIFPWQGGGLGGVLFSSETLNNSFGYALNKSYMINKEGDILSSGDFSLVRSGINISDEDFIRDILASPERSRQHLVESEFKFMQASAAPVNLQFYEEVLENVKQTVLPFIKKASAATVDITFQFLRTINIDSFLKINLNKPKLNVAGQAAGGNAVKDGKTRQFVAFTKLNSGGAVVITSIEYHKVFEGIAATTRRNIYLTMAVLCVSIVFIWFFSKTISIPLKSLASAARSIEGGRFELDLQSKSKDELGVLTVGFQKMCSALKIFGKFTNKEIAIKAMRGQIKPGGLPKHGTVFFSDIREFTAKSENFTNIFGEEASDRIVRWLNEYFTKMIECVEKTNGVVDKFIGDAVMAHWGTAYTDGSPFKDAYNCVKASLMMRQALYEMNRGRTAASYANPPIRIGCGINTGIVTAGQLGSDVRMEYTVIGDPVNLASRIESLTKPLGADILISEDTWSLVREKFITEEMPSVTVKGKEKPVRIFAVVNFMGANRGPVTLRDVRNLLGIEPPDMTKVDVNADEKKYKIGEHK